MLSLLFVSASGFTTVDVSSKFFTFASSFCGSDNVHNADIGNGNLVNDFKSADMKLLGAEHIESSRAGAAMAKLSKEELIAAGFRPGRAAGPGLEENLGDCNEQYGNTCQNSGGLYHWCNYSQYKCMSKYAGQNGAVTYYNMDKNPAVPEIYELYYDNDYPANTSSSITKTISSSSTQTISTTISINIGESLEIKAGVPDIMDVTETFSFSFDMSTTNTDSKTTTDSFSWTGNIPEEAMSTTMVQFTVTKEKYSGAWKADINLPYYAKLWCNNEVNGHHEWFLPAQSFMGSDGPYQGEGVFTGGAGVSMHTTVRKCKLFATTLENCDGPKTVSVIKNSELAAPVRFS